MSKKYYCKDSNLRLKGCEMNLRGKARDQIEVALAGRTRSELLDIIFSLTTIEECFKPSEIAARTHVNKRRVLRDIRDGKFGDYYCRAENSIIVPASGVAQWLRRFRVPAPADSK